MAPYLVSEEQTVTLMENSNQILCELIEEWSKGAGPIVMEVVVGLYAAIAEECK